MSDEGVGSLGIWNAKWNFSRIDREEYPNLIICFNLNDEFWVLTTYGEIHVFRISDKIGIIQLKSKDIMVTDVKICPDNSIACGTSNGEVFKQSLSSFIN